MDELDPDAIPGYDLDDRYVSEEEFFTDPFGPIDPDLRFRTERPPRSLEEIMSVPRGKVSTLTKEEREMRERELRRRRKKRYREKQKEKKVTESSKTAELEARVERLERAMEAMVTVINRIASRLERRD